MVSIPPLGTVRCRNPCYHSVAHHCIPIAIQTGRFYTRSIIDVGLAMGFHLPLVLNLMDLSLVYIYSPCHCNHYPSQHSTTPDYSSLSGWWHLGPALSLLLFMTRIARDFLFSFPFSLLYFFFIVMRCCGKGDHQRVVRAPGFPPRDSFFQSLYEGRAIKSVSFWTWVAPFVTFLDATLVRTNIIIMLLNPSDRKGLT
ncbi:hypothetical protein M413DRAFT_81392 [Hebeloma cylindrosporum]|uniref:Uncharacterized protein n=1 Tax=Hebeloma cylindrosporum TaxID=76867 RepID=A0A0C2YFS7_HEBCY|nr:hypothetical protein M413DRAFT_81392 [Hebeloma cylindrosporum h7]